MKKITIAVLLLALAGCQTSDQEIRADIAGKAQQDLDFAGLQYTVANGVVNFIGRCSSAKSFAKVQQTIENIHVIKAVHYKVLIAPVTLDTLTQVKLQTDSILAQYPQVSARVDTNIITLKGPVNSAQQKKLIQEVQKRNHGRVIDSLTIQ
jgi:osmotically-inducible protein OsmY